MRQPLWLVNILLICIILISELIFLLVQTSIPRRFSLEPGVLPVQEKKVETDVDIKNIYEVNDLFGTYVSGAPVLAKGVAQFEIPPIPMPPPLISLEIPVEVSPVFSTPLTIILKGIIYLHDDSEKSVAIIQFKGSKKENNYSVGEVVQDAQILKIFPNRVILVRTNGQQETLYLRDQDLEKDFNQDSGKGLSSLVIYEKHKKRYVLLEPFLTQVGSLGQFIDMLEIRTVYQKGKSVGCRIGKATKESLGGKLGFEKDDLIKKIDSIAVVDLHSRIDVYDHVCEKKSGDEISVELERGGHLITMTFVLTSQEEGSDSVNMEGLNSQGIKSSAGYNTEENKKKILEQRVKLAPTAHQIQMDDQKKLIEARKKNMLSNQHNPKR